ncbi:MAG: 2-C-methyl-D-erythritol 4-phosphate cytidylyltransferase [Chloroflexota bacterium]|nr:2-C-methyl-D-erythritol 4-phosphate cytidylyltransferase [Chloroflexota bacterium]
MTTAARPLAGVLVAAGRGRRMGSDKLWLEPLGRAIWRWSLDALLAVPGMEVVALVVPADGLERYRTALPPHAAQRCRLVAGGEARTDSVRVGLEALVDAGVGAGTVVLVHDAARPAASAALMERVARAAGDGDAAIPVVAVNDTLKRARDGQVLDTVDRTDLVAAQTPQAAGLGVLRSALEAARSQGWEPTDEAAALTAIGVSVRTVEGDPANRKLTEPADAELLRGILRSRMAPLDEPIPGTYALVSASRNSVRAGVGVDAHRLESGRPLRLGGLAFPDEPRGLVGHSDGDAALHAVIDALLGAAGQGDIGTLFPADDASRDADSGELLRLVVEQVRAAGWEPRSVDLAIGAERPAIGPRRDEMAARVAGLVGLPAGEVSVRGTTTDGLGFPGQEGIAAWAVALVERTR